MDYSRELEFLKETVVSAYKSGIKNRVEVSGKGEFDIVTTVDRAIEKLIVENIRRAFPGDRIHGEEFSPDLPVGDRTWIIDPIDGTVNFSTGSGDFGVQCAFFDRGETRVSVMFIPKTNKLFWAEKGKGAFCDSERISAKKRRVIESVISFGDIPHTRPCDAKDQTEAMLRAAPRVMRMRMFGASSIDFTLAAAGITDGVLLYTKNKWDLYPGILLCLEAGMTALSPAGTDYSSDDRGVLVCTSREIYNALFID